MKKIHSDKKHLPHGHVFLRNFIFGVEDSLVSTVALLAGIAVAGTDRGMIFLSGTVLIFVEAFSMAAGSFLAEDAEELAEHQKDVAHRTAFLGATIMFLSYFIAGLIPLLPYLFLHDGNAFWTSITLTIIALGVLGIIEARLTRVPAIRQMFKVALIGGVTTFIGVLVGSAVSGFR